MPELFISREFVEQMVTHCTAFYPNEACGILAGTGNRVTKVYPMTNAEPSPVSYFMEPAEQFNVMKILRAEGSAMVAIFHSHPQSPAFPSAKDVSLAFYDDLYYVIVGLLNRSRPDIRMFSIAEGEASEATITVID